MLVFMTLSLGVEAQVQSPGDVLAERQGVSLVDGDVAQQRIKTHINQLEAINPSTQEERADVAVRRQFAINVMDSAAGTGSYKYELMNDGLNYVNELVEAANTTFGVSLDGQVIYDELVDLLGS